MISMDELLKGAKLEDQDPEVQANLKILLDRVNRVRDQWGKAMTVTSGLRTKEDQIRVYKAKGITDLAKIPMGSMHLKGGAVDIYDPGLTLTTWLKENNSQRLVDAQLWCEAGNSDWVHMQICPPRSGARWFYP